MKLQLFIIAALFTIVTGNPGVAFSGKKPFIHHIVNFVNSLTNGTATSANNTASTTVTMNLTVSTSKPVVRSPVVVRANENPANAVQRMSNNLEAVNLVSTIAPPKVRPCFVRPAFCPATSDACAMSQCARMYANGVRIGSRYYRKVKCRLNYCRETCGKAEWFADGRRLIGCSDSVSTIDQPIWSIERSYPGSSRLDSRVLPIERVAPKKTNNMGSSRLQRRGISHEFFNGVKSALQDAQEHAQNIGAKMQDAFGNLTSDENVQKMQEHAENVGTKIKQTFEELNPNSEKRAENAIEASNVKNLTEFVDQQLADASKPELSGRAELDVEASKDVEHDVETENLEKSSSAVMIKASSILLVAIAFAM